MTEDESSRRAVRAQTAVMRTLADEVNRPGRGPEQAAALRAQALEESARLVSTVEGRSRASSSPPGAARPEVKGPSEEQRWPRVLVVEDDDAALDALVRCLASEYEVVAARNGVEGLEAASARPFDAIVADIGLPHLDGVTMVERIRRVRAPSLVPVIFLTGETAPDRIADGFQAGGTSYLTKPVDLDLLCEELLLALAAPSD